MRKPPSEWLKHNWLELLLLLLTAGALLWLVSTGQEIWRRIAPPPAVGEYNFNSERAFETLRTLADFGPRQGGSPGHTAAAGYIEQTLAEAGWQVDVQPFEIGEADRTARRNIIARAGSGPVFVLGTHYDSTPTGGANDGASAVAVLLELARSLDTAELPGEVRLVFADGQYTDRGAAVARGMALAPNPAISAEQQTIAPTAVILLDLVGSTDERLYLDGGLNQPRSSALWQTVDHLNYEPWFVRRTIDDLDLGQTALAQGQLAVTVLAGVDYAERGSNRDTPDKLDAASLGRVGTVLEVYLATQADTQ